jgi:hypothetical protein
MFDKPIDFKKLHKDIRNTYKRQLAIKKEYPHKYQYPSFEMYLSKRVQYKQLVEEQKPWAAARTEFNRLSHRMTKLCCILAHAKGELHMTRVSKETAAMYGMINGGQHDLSGVIEKVTMPQQAKVFGTMWEEYILEQEPEDVFTANTLLNADLVEDIFKRFDKMKPEEAA